MSRAVLVVVIVSCVPLFAQQGNEWTVRVRSLAPFVEPRGQLAEPICSAIPGDSVNDVSLRLDASESTLAPDWLLALLAQRHRAAIDANRLTLALGSATRRPTEEDGQRRPGTNLVLRGRAAEVAACETDLDAIAAAVGRPIEVTAWRLPLGPDAFSGGALPATTLDAPALQQLLQRTPPLWTTRGRTRSGGALRLAQERGTAYLRDLDVEVAERAKIFDPKVDLAFAGTRATLVVDALPGDDVLLRGSWLASERVAMHEQDCGERAISVDLPEQRTAWVTFAGRVSSGGALVVAGRGGPAGPEGFVLVLGARYLAPPPGDASPDLLVRPIGALLGSPHAMRPRLEWPRPGDESESFVRVERDGGLAARDLLDVLAVTPPAEAMLEGGVLVVHGDAQRCREAEAWLQQLANTLRPATLHTRVADAAGTLELVQPLLADRIAAAFVGNERAVVRDHEVEISQGAAAANPVIGVVRTGLWLGATAARSGDAWHIAGSWSVAAMGEPRVREHADQVRMAMQLVDYRLTTLPWDATMAPDQEHELGSGPAWVPGGAATRVSVRLVTR